MFYPSKEQFIELSKQGNLIPVCKELVADMETPVSAFKKITASAKGDDYSFLLESVEGGENVARYSFLGTTPQKIFSFDGKKDPFSELEKIITRYKPVVVPNMPRFHGGLVGYISYDAVRFVENIPAKNKDDLKLPIAQFMLTDTILAFDHVKHKILIISNAFVENNPEKAYRDACEKISALEKKLKKSLKGDDFEIPSMPKKELKIRSNFTQKEYESVVEKAKEYIRSGDIIQVVPSQRFETKFDGDPFNVYRILRTINPSPYMYYLKFKDLKIVGASPEVMVRFENGKATLRPIAGTRPRGKTEKEDKSFEKELLASEKERAEHVMLVDLARNDLGRVCKANTIKIDEIMSVERYSHVMHIVSNVTGALSDDKNAFDLIRASFPAGTVSGAPKVRAMEIIDELENIKRGPYAGAIGYFSFSGEMDTCITIRTLILKNKKAYIQAGAGIVSDSVPSEEYQETCNKASAMLRAVELCG
ncbi:anthranilate synthase component I [candidate division WOR-1 bacterium RIFOXYA2_FULL_36_21]|uniref:Anthranilate synthase component 1 n=1 Tax=candidate division WOR-1 bacterium RIFOXYB2_FULL_36_35 TaxID=1802578 RepID=A0A1F4S3B0_UNCSA|nr:MAG: anthranilate synthase component I [candidate division WOR-1 bacterium RIFOXYA2_FULL_36_21]OGC14910.1 MAG: anthranilate synthase component I [candidate division WOR-1 bacterium RIFOXYB2_FULL_36_35]OGC16739.1 MAG: anthranilate synthase component I [candidate division WOR-1 bacterium RIFOXYA12_FULL_36_13]